MTSSSSSNSPCAACKLQRRKCTQGCIFASCFPPDNPQKFASVHRVFGASNVAKILNDLPYFHREDAANSLAFEADARLRDPVYGCVGYISYLQHKLKLIRQDTEMARKELSAYIGPSAFAPFIPPYQSSYAVEGMDSLHPHHHYHQSMRMGMGLGLAATDPQMLLREQQQQQQQHLTMVTAATVREQEILLSLEQQQQNYGNSGILFNQEMEGSIGNGNGDGSAMVTVVSGEVVAGGDREGCFALGSLQPVQEQFENNYAFHMYDQQQQRHQQEHQVVHLTQYLEHHHQKNGREERGVASGFRHLEI